MIFCLAVFIIGLGVPIVRYAFLGNVKFSGAEFL